MDEEIEIVRSVFAAGTPALAAFDYFLAHAQAAGFKLVPRIHGDVLSVEIQKSDVRRNPFSAQASTHHVNFYLRRPILNEHEGLFEAAVARFGPVRSNSLNEYRRHLHSPDEVDEMLAFLREQGAWPGHRHAKRFVSATFKAITSEHLLRAAQRLAAGQSYQPFGPSTDYDLLFEGQRLPPKAVFGRAATEALGFPVRPENFSAGEGMVCFRILRESGFVIVPKGEEERVDPALISDEDRVWTEGRPKLVTHLRRERGSGLAAAKREQFRAKHGRLYCERCGLDPVDAYHSTVGEACIEVHHRDTRLAEMETGHQTRLEDLACLCASCHRVTHRELKDQVAN